MLSFPIYLFLHTLSALLLAHICSDLQPLHNRDLLLYFEMVCRVPMFPPARVFNTTTFSLSAFVGSVAHIISRASFTWFLVLGSHLCGYVRTGARDEALVGWWRGFVLVGMLGGGCCNGSLGFLLLYFMA
ncbi:hypothetical protein D8674_008235 [Pyrus ussuriensis x Pyrus communis]|uniref:Uncharacterized protein n=1 Tax=Pyrus ussuriensis x Pyrus communis TaxID=2448454 RepID=A0A5N5HS76_9ROSA|nr:hypothetical protein D8674_008235 [Pyrus ussuriensis x Pyrus communis]